jgi:1,4-dihydroxy-2-naphthoate octaprenyltransferase
MSTAVSPPGAAVVWLRAVRAFSFTASLTPVVFALALAAVSGHEIIGALVPLVVVGALLLHAGTNYVSDAIDYQKGVDRPGSRGGSGVLVAGLLPATAVLRAGRLCLLAAVALGVPLVLRHGWPMLAIGLAGVIGGYTYSGGPRGSKYLGLGDVAVFALMGPLMVAGAHLGVTGHVDARVLLVGVPVGLLATVILAVNNLRDIDDDRAVGVHTLAGRLGPRGAAVHVVALTALAYLATVALVVLRLLPVTALAALVTLPLALGLTRLVLTHRHGEATGALDHVDQRAAQLHLAFGVLLTLGTLAGRWL